MAKIKRNTIFLGKLFIVCTIVVSSVLLLLKYISNVYSHDIENSLETINKEITDNIDTVTALTNGNKKDDDVVLRMEAMINDILLAQSRQSKEMSKQRRFIEKKISELKQNSDQGTLRERLSYNFEYDTSKKFPAYIWQMHTEQKLNGKQDSKVSKLKKTINPWEERNPGFAHELFNHPDFVNAMLRHHYSLIPEIIEAYMALPSDILRVDFFKYLILLARGGVYSDSDTKPLCPIPNWIPEDINPKSVGLVIGIEHDANPTGWETTGARKLQFGTWIIQCKPGHPVIREIVARIVDITSQRKKDDELSVNYRNDLNVMNWTGAGLWTDIIFLYFNNYLKSGIDRKITRKEFNKLTEPKLLSDVLVFPRFSFNAPEKILDDDPYKSLYFCTHDKKKSWKNVPKIEN